CAGTSAASADPLLPPAVFFFQAEDGIRDFHVTGVQTCALPISVTSTGRLHNGQLELDADWNIGGTLRRQPLSLQGAVGARDEQWQFRELNLQQGENRISGAGQLRKTVSGALDLQLPALHTLWPGLGGQLAGRIQASGAAASPKISMDIKGQRLAFDAFAMANLDLAGTVTLDEQLPGSLNLTAARLRNGDT